VDKLREKQSLAESGKGLMGDAGIQRGARTARICTSRGTPLLPGGLQRIEKKKLRNEQGEKKREKHVESPEAQPRKIRIAAERRQKRLRRNETKMRERRKG